MQSPGEVALSGDLRAISGEGDGGDDDVDEMLEKYINDSAGTAVQNIGGARAESSNGASPLDTSPEGTPLSLASASQLTGVCLIVAFWRGGTQVASQTTCSCWSAPGSQPAVYCIAHRLGTAASRSFS